MLRCDCKVVKLKGGWKDDPTSISYQILMEESSQKQVIPVNQKPMEYRGAPRSPVDPMLQTHKGREVFPGKGAKGITGPLQRMMIKEPYRANLPR
jgi:hypothetical protein